MRSRSALMVVIMPGFMMGSSLSMLSRDDSFLDMREWWFDWMVLSGRWCGVRAELLSKPARRRERSKSCLRVGMQLAMILGICEHEREHSD